VHAGRSGLRAGDQVSLQGGLRRLQLDGGLVRAALEAHEIGPRWLAGAMLASCAPALRLQCGAQPRQRGGIGGDGDVHVRGEARLEPRVHRVASDDRLRHGGVVEDAGERLERARGLGHGR
jgi:hypothetical protein